MNKKDYRDLFKRKRMSIDSAEFIKNNIINDKTHKQFKPIYVCLFAICFLATIVTPVTANIIGNNLIEVDKNNKYQSKDESPWEKAVYYNKKIDKEYPSNILTINNIYTIDYLEQKLGIEIPKNDRIIIDNLRVDTIESIDKKVTKININNQDEKGIYINNTKKRLGEEIGFGLTIYTKYNTKDINLIGAMNSGQTKSERYYIKNLETEAIIIYDDVKERKLDDNKTVTPTLFLVGFEYKGVIYGLTIDGFDNYTINDVYEILDSFYR